MKNLIIFLTVLMTQNIIEQEVNNFSSKKMKEKFNIQFIGKYYTGRSPCELLPNGMRRWNLVSGFEVKKNIIGIINTKTIQINSKIGKNNAFKVGKNYKVSLSLSKERLITFENKNTITTPLNQIVNEEIVEIIETKENLNCLTKENFNLVFEKIKLRLSGTIIEYNSKKWEIYFSANEKKEQEISFKKDNWSIGKITSDLKVYSFIKDLKNNEKSKLEIKNIFCNLYDWANEDISIQIEN